VQTSTKLTDAEWVLYQQLASSLMVETLPPALMLVSRPAYFYDPEGGGDMFL
jgi:hypothetical protein